MVAHRGASAEAPENTLTAIRLALAQGVDAVEVDVQRTKDGALVVLHDASLARTTDVRHLLPRRSPWLVSDLTLDEVRRLDAGAWRGPSYAGERVPTLQEVVETVRSSRAGLLVEVKETGLHPGLALDVADALAAIPGYLADAVADRRLVVQSFDAAAMQDHKEREPSVPVGVLGTPTRAELGALATWADEVNPAHWSVGPEWVETVHRHGLRTRVWTVNRPATMRRATGLGVDAVITDRPRLLQGVLAHPSSSARASHSR